MRGGFARRCTHHAVNHAHCEAVGQYHPEGEQRGPQAEAKVRRKRAQPQQWKENQIHRQPSDYTGDEPLLRTAAVRQMPVEIGKSKASCSRAVDIRKQPRYQRMNVLPGPVTKRDLETLIGLERFKYTQFGFAKHQQGVRDTSA